MLATTRAIVFITNGPAHGNVLRRGTGWPARRSLCACHLRYTHARDCCAASGTSRTRLSPQTTLSAGRAPGSIPAGPASGGSITAAVPARTRAAAVSVRAIQPRSGCASSNASMPITRSSAATAATAATCPNDPAPVPAPSAAVDQPSMSATTPRQAVRWIRERNLCHSRPAQKASARNPPSSAAAQRRDGGGGAALVTSGAPGSALIGVGGTTLS